MPSLTAFGRRWHTATDTFPLLGEFLGLFHITWMMAYGITAVGLDTSGVRSTACGQRVLFATCCIGIFAVFAVSAIAEFAMVGIGLRGGPFEASKRRAMHPLIHLLPVLWLLLLIWTVLGTYLIASTNISQACWEDNPCLYKRDATQCISTNGDKPTDIAPPCQELYQGLKEAAVCWAAWLGIGQKWTELGETCPEATDPYVMIGFSYLSIKYNLDMEQESHPIPESLSGLEEALLLHNVNNSEVPDRFNQSDPWSQCLGSSCEHLLGAVEECHQSDVLMTLKPPESSSAKVYFTALIHSSWGALVITALVVLLVFNSFPELDTIDSWEGTLKGLARMFCCGSLLQQEAQAVQGSRGPASKEIAKSLLALFGGVDLDPTDRLLALYLVSQQQVQRRRKHLLGVLPEAGEAELPSSPGSLWRTLQGYVLGKLQQRRQIRSTTTEPSSSTTVSGDVSSNTSASRHAALLSKEVPQPPLPAAAQNTTVAAAQRPQHLVEKGQTLEHLVPRPPKAPDVLRRSAQQAAVASHVEPGNQPAPGVVVCPLPAGSNISHRSSWRKLLPLYRETLLRLRTSAVAQLLQPSKAGTGGSEAPGREADCHGGAASSATEDKMLKAEAGSPQGELASLARLARQRMRPPRPLRQSAGSMASTTSITSQPAVIPAGSSALGSSAAVSSWTGSAAATGAGSAGGSKVNSPGCDGDVHIRIGACYRPMLTPSGCLNKHRIAPREAANLFSGYHEPVSKQVLEEAHSVRRFAVGAYDLQSVLWAKGRPAPMCLGNINMFLKCLGRPLQLDSKFRKNNFKAIMKITGAEPCDLLYVSYADAPGGVLPYMLMLDRGSKSVVLAVRGTVSMEDLVTDLLSTSVDVAGWMPDWVCQAASSGEGTYAHLGIVSSATAILKDLEDHGLLQELCTRVGVSPDKATLIRSSRGETQGSGSFYSRSTQGSSTPASNDIAVSSPLPGTATTFITATGPAGPAGAAGRPREGGRVQRLLSWHESLNIQQQPSTHAFGGSKRHLGQGVEEEDEFGLETRVEIHGQSGSAGSMPDIAGMQDHAEVRLPLNRAQSVIQAKVQQEGWRVVVTGHSLGAAVACLLGFHLREVFPDLRCWCFNPPGGLLSWNLSLLAQRFCNSVVVGKDVISRLSFNNARGVVDEMVTTLARCKRPKLLVLADLILRRQTSSSAISQTFCALNEISDDAVRVLEGYYRTSFLHSRDQIVMYPPGRLLFLRPFKGKTKQHKVVWDAVWTDAQASMGEGILLAPSMLAHHRLFVLDGALLSVLGQEAEPEVTVDTGYQTPDL